MVSPSGLFFLRNLNLPRVVTLLSFFLLLAPAVLRVCAGGVPVLLGPQLLPPVAGQQAREGGGGQRTGGGGTSAMIVITKRTGLPHCAKIFCQGGEPRRLSWRIFEPAPWQHWHISTMSIQGHKKMSFYYVYIRESVLYIVRTARLESRNCRPFILFFFLVGKGHHHHLPNHQRWYAKWKLSWNVYTLHACFCTLCANLCAQSVLINKISASELRQKFIKIALSVGYTHPRFPDKERLSAKVAWNGDAVSSPPHAAASVFQHESPPPFSCTKKTC